MNYIFSYNVDYYPGSDFLSRNYIGSFCESLRRITFNGKLVLFTESPDRLKPFIKGLDVTIVPVQDITDRFHKNNYHLISGLENCTLKKITSILMITSYSSIVVMLYFKMIHLTLHSHQN
jgi:hypothetical protein